MKRKNSKVPLEENEIVCPSCEEEEEVIKKEKKKIQWTKKKIIKLVLAIVAGVLVLALLTGILILALRENDVYYKSEYTTSEFWSKLTHDQVVATMGEYELTNGQLQVFYWMQVYDLVNYYTETYGDYASYILGIDLSKPLSEQIYKEETGMTWEQYFIEDAIYAWHRNQALVDEAKKAGYQMPAEYQQSFAEMRSSMETSAEENGYESVDAMLQADLGCTVTFDDYYYYLETYYIANLYFNEVTAKLAFTDAEMEEFFARNEESLAAYGITKESGNMVDFRNILVQPVSTTDTNGNSVYTDDAWEDCLAKAEAIWETWQASDLSEATFTGLAKLKSEDDSSSSNGGLYQYIMKNDWATVDVRHILITPNGGTKDDDGNITYSDEEWEACRAAAQAILEEYLAGTQTEDAFGALANEYSDDNDGKVTDGGLYTDVYVGQMVQAFEDWCFDASRTSGETGLVKTEYGYHVMYFVDRHGPVDAWLFAEDRKVGDSAMVKTEYGYEILYYVGDDVAWEVWCRQGLLTETTEDMIQSYADAHPIEVKYWAIMLSERPEE